MAKKRELTRANYYDPGRFWSASFVKQMMDCPSRAIAEFRGEYKREDTTALLVGSYVDAALEGKRHLEMFKANHPEILNSRTGELKADYRLADRMVERARSDELFMSYAHGQKQHIITGEIFGVPFKCRPDFIDRKNGRIVDLKTCRDFESMYRAGEGRISFAEYWRYPLQMAVYRELVRQETGETMECYLACISKQDPPDIMVLYIPSYALDAEMKELEQRIPRWEAMLEGIIEPEGCGTCEYCRTHKVLTEAVSLDDLNEL